MADADEEWTPQGPVLDVSGKLEGQGSKPVVPPAPRAPRAANDDVLELQWDNRRDAAPIAAPVSLQKEVPLEKEKSVAQPKPPPQPSSFPWRWMVGAILVFGAAAAAYITWIPPPNAKPSSGKAIPILQIESEPSGAAIYINGEKMGETPFFIENQYATASMEVRVVKKHYQPWNGTFIGGRNAQIHAVLKR